MKKINKFLTLLLPTTLMASSCLSITSCNKNNIDKELYEATIQEFVDYCKVPHPSYNDKQDKTKSFSYLDKAREYFTKKAKDCFNATVEKDNYGNIWFDVGAAKGCESWPKVILQGHMDMWIAGLSAEECKTTGIEPVIETVDGREVMHTKNNKTSLGADNGIGIAIALALLKNPNVKHGPVRMLLTADEELGLKGAEALDSRAIDSDLLINLDAEGKEGTEYVVCRGYGGIQGYLWSKTFTPITPTTGTNNFIKITLSGFEQKNNIQAVHFTNEGITAIANANRILMRFLANFMDKNPSKHIELAEYYDYDQDETEGWYQNPALDKIPASASITIGLSNHIDASTLQTGFTSFIDKQCKSVYKGTDWTKVEVEVENIQQGSAPTAVLSVSESEALIKLFGKTMPTSCITDADWEGSNKEEKIAFDFPVKINNCNGFAFSATDATTPGLFTCHVFGQSTTTDACKELTIYDHDIWENLFDGTVTTKMQIDPWDVLGLTKLYDLTWKAFDSINIKASNYKVRGAMGENTWFAKKHAHLQQTSIGPRIDKCHTVDETVYLDTVENLIKVAKYLLENLN